MDVSAVPFNQFLGLRASGAALKLAADPKYHNHLGTVHASAQFALAEAASGQWLLDHFGDAVAEYVAVVRHVDVKYRRPAAGELTAHASAPPEEPGHFLEALTRRGRATIEVRVHVVGNDGNATLEAVFEWFAQRSRVAE
jgi:acyl-coenzyme A thioesterase PaaI-like protein